MVTFYSVKPVIITNVPEVAVITSVETEGLMSLVDVRVSLHLPDFFLHFRVSTVFYLSVATKLNRHYLAPASTPIGR